VWTPEVKRPLGRPKCRRDATTVNLKGTAWERVDWIHLTQDRYKQQALVKEVMNLQVSYNAGDFLNYMKIYWLLKKLVCL
jgi:hypothetical protein